MRDPIAVYFKGADLPDLLWALEDSLEQIIDFTGYTFVVKVGPEGSTTSSFTKTTGITGTATDPNITVAWATTGELSTLAAGRYTIQLVATAGGKDRIFQGIIEIRGGVLA